jgi:hypothetical protein
MMWPDVGLDGGLGDVQQRGDLRVGQAGADLGQHLAFPDGELGEVLAVRDAFRSGQVRQEAADQAARGGGATTESPLLAPFGPRKPVTRPGRTVNDRSSTASLSP